MKKEIYTYFAYGSNLNKAQMRLPCPGQSIKDHNLVFRESLTSSTPCDGHDVPVGIWRITQDCLTLWTYTKATLRCIEEILGRKQSRLGDLAGHHLSDEQVLLCPVLTTRFNRAGYFCDLNWNRCEALHNTLCEVSKSERNHGRYQGIKEARLTLSEGGDSSDHEITGSPANHAQSHASIILPTIIDII